MEQLQMVTNFIHASTYIVWVVAALLKTSPKTELDKNANRNYILHVIIFKICHAEFVNDI